MEDNKKDAYLHLMYRAFVEIRNISINAFIWYNPKTWNKNKIKLRRINRLANVMHNLPFDLKTSNIKVCGLQIPVCKLSGLCFQKNLTVHV